MSFTGVFGLVLLGVVAIALLGPSKLPAGVEQIWLMITNFRRSQNQLPQLNMEQARVLWARSESPLYDLVQILYGSVEHLVELRHRIFMVIGAMVVGAAIALFFANTILGLLTRPAAGVQLIVLRPTDMVFIYIEIVMSAGAITALPMVLYQSLMFIHPALESPQELSLFRAVAILGMPLVLVFFALGLSFAYFIMLPFAIKYLSSFGTEFAKPSWNIKEYYSFIFAVLLWIGAAFETPLVMALLARLGLVSPAAMAKQWRYAIVGMAIVAAVITPTVDPFNMMVVMVPLVALYFTGILMARAVYRKRTSPSAELEASA
jgi:sec-independent protein translocase protein TatC